jgi:iron uptake system component EfeO
VEQPGAEVGAPMNLTCCDNPPESDVSSSASGGLYSGHRQVPGLASILSVAALGIGLVGPMADPGHAASLDERVERYRSHLIRDVDSTVMSVRKLQASVAANDLEGAKQAWIDARIGWERSEVFTSGFVPQLDKDIDAWPNGRVGFHAIEAKLFGVDGTGVEDEVDALLLSVSELSTTVREIELTPQGLLNGIARLAYEVGESKVDGGESRVSGTSIDDMRNNVDGIELAYRTIFASAIEAGDPQGAAQVGHKIDELKAMLGSRDIRQLDPEKLTAISEELVLMLQNAAPRIELERPTLEESVQ